MYTLPSCRAVIHADSQALKLMMVVWPAICTSTHLILTASILYGLYRTREGANQTRVMVDRIIFMSLESQVPGTILYVSFLLPHYVVHPDLQRFRRHVPYRCRPLLTFHSLDRVCPPLRRGM